MFYFNFKKPSEVEVTIIPAVQGSQGRYRRKWENRGTEPRGHAVGLQRSPQVGRGGPEAGRAGGWGQRGGTEESECAGRCGSTFPQLTVGPPGIWNLEPRSSGQKVGERGSQRTWRSWKEPHELTF